MQQELTSPGMVWFLRDHVGDDQAVHGLVTRYAGWDDLSSAAPADLLRSAGTHVAPFPATRPLLPAAPPGVEVITRYDPRYPEHLLNVARPPALFFVAGKIPREHSVAVIGSSTPTDAGVVVSKSAGIVAARLGVPLVAPMTAGCSLAAVNACLRHHGRVVLVVPHGFGTGSAMQRLMESVVASGGAVLSAFSPMVQVTDAHTSAAGAIAVSIASATIAAEVGPYAHSAQQEMTAAVDAQVPLIAPAPSDPTGFVPPSSIGNLVLTSVHDWTETYFGTNERIASRVAHNKPAADAVVRSEPDLAAAIAHVREHGRAVIDQGGH